MGLSLFRYLLGVGIGDISTNSYHMEEYGSVISRPIPIIACASLQEKSSQDGLRWMLFSTEDGQLP